jgi:hypothetical protein
MSSFKNKTNYISTHSRLVASCKLSWNLIRLSRRPADFFEFATEVAYQAHTEGVYYELSCPNFLFHTSGNIRKNNLTSSYLRIFV